MTQAPLKDPTSYHHHLWGQDFSTGIPGGRRHSDTGIASLTDGGLQRGKGGQVLPLTLSHHPLTPDTVGWALLVSGGFRNEHCFQQHQLTEDPGPARPPSPPNDHKKLTSPRQASCIPDGTGEGPPSLVMPGLNTPASDESEKPLRAKPGITLELRIYPPLCLQSPGPWLCHPCAHSLETKRSV